MRNGLKWMSVLTSAGMFFVLLAGALVTKTESGAGCGNDWPLCNGKFIPAYTLESFIEYSHRAITGIVGLLVLFTAIWVWRRYAKGNKARLYAGGALFFTVLQAVLGAMAVIWDQSSAVMALHFGFSLLAFSSTLLLAIAVFEGEATQGTAETGGLPKISKAFRQYVWFVTAFTYFVVYIGAFVRHTESGGGCIGWPLCNGEVIPSLSGIAGIAFGHRVAAFVLLCLIIRMTCVVYRSYSMIPELRRSALAVLIFVIAQVASGALVVFSKGADAYIFASMLHTVIIAGLFGVLCYSSIRVWELYRN
ncbi:MAG TPA: heme A synthase [Bacilli bacterium]